MGKQVYYVLVESTTEGWALYNAIRNEGCKTRIAPVPRGLQACCGMALLVEQEDIQQVRQSSRKARYARI